MIGLAGVATPAVLRRWSGLSDPTPDRARIASAAIALALMVGLTIIGANPEQLGPGAGKLFLVYAVIVGPAVAALLVLRPWSDLVAWAAMMPLLNVVRLEAWAGSVQVTQSTLMIGAFAAGVVLDRRHAGTEAAPETDGDRAAARAPWPRAASAVAGGLILFSILSLLASPAKELGTPIVIHGAIEPVLLGLLVLAARPTPRASLALGAGLVVGLALATVYNVGRLGRIATTVAEFETLRVNLARLTFYNVGIYGDALAMVIPLGVALFLWRRPLRLGRASTIAVVIMLAILFGGLYLTFSKSAWLGTWLAVTGVLIARYQRPGQIGAIILGAAVAVMLIVPYPIAILNALHIDSSVYQSVISDVQGSRLSSWDVGSPEGEVSIGERWRATVASVRMTVDHPLFGVGPGRFGDEYAGPYADPGATRKLGSPHDLLPDVASEFGLPAAVLLVIAFVAALWAAWRAVRDADPVLRATAGAFGAALVAFLVVTATFGLDLYRDYRVMNSDVLMGALLVAVCLSLAAWVRGAPPPQAASAG